jgi:hypothetical protein
VSGVVDRFAGVFIDAIGLPWCLVIVIGGAVLLALAWSTWPRWWPRASWWAAIVRVFRWRGRRGAKGPRRKFSWPKWRWPWRRRKKAAQAKVREIRVLTEPIEGDTLPDVPAEVLVSLADRLAAEGRYAESVRERLRGMVRELVDAGVVENRPSLTVSELARAAATRRPPMGSPLGEAVTIFSDIWYGERDAHLGHDRAMRDHAAAVHQLVAAGR